MKPKLKPDIIHRLGRVIDHDFSVEFPDLFTPEDFKAAPKGMAALEVEDEIDVWKEKYIDLLERYNFLLSRN